MRRTGRAIVVHEASGFGGYGAEVAARLTEQCFHYLEAPILRVTGLDIPYPPPMLESTTCPASTGSSTRSRACSGTTTSCCRMRWANALMPDFLLPDLGEGLTEAEIVALAGRSRRRGRRRPAGRRGRDGQGDGRGADARSPDGAGTARNGREPRSSVGSALLTVDAAMPADGGKVLIGYGISDTTGRSAALAAPARNEPQPLPAPSGSGSSRHWCGGWPASPASMCAKSAAPGRTAWSCVATSSR